MQAKGKGKKGGKIKPGRMVKGSGMASETGTDVGSSVDTPDTKRLAAAKHKAAAAAKAAAEDADSGALRDDEEALDTGADADTDNEAGSKPTSSRAKPKKSGGAKDSLASRLMASLRIGSSSSGSAVAPQGAAGPSQASPLGKEAGRGGAGAAVPPGGQRERGRAAFTEEHGVTEEAAAPRSRSGDSSLEATKTRDSKQSGGAGWEG